MYPHLRDLLTRQVCVQRRDVQYDIHTPPTNYTWDELKDLQRFQDCFGPISRQQLALEDELERFSQYKTRYAYRDIGTFGRGKFTSSIRQVSQILQAAVKEVIARRIRADVSRANELVAQMEAKWGRAGCVCAPVRVVERTQAPIHRLVPDRGTQPL